MSSVVCGPAWYAGDKISNLKFWDNFVMRYVPTAVLGNTNFAQRRRFTPPCMWASFLLA